MEFLSKTLNTNSAYCTLLSDVKAGRLPVATSGLSQIHKSVIASALSDNTNKKIVNITPDEASATEMLGDLTSLGKKTLFFPVRDYCFTDAVQHSKEYEHKRIATLSALSDGAFDVLVLPAAAAVQYTVPPETLNTNSFKISVGAELSPENLCDKLITAGYTRTEQVEGVGQFSSRGGIVDVFVTNAAHPVRIEYWGDEIDSINYFDTETQRRTDRVEEIKVTPAAEIVADNAQLIEKVREFSANKKRLPDKQRMRLENDMQLLSAGVSVPLDRYLPLIYTPCTVLDYLSGAVTVISDYTAVTDNLKTFYNRFYEDTKYLLQEGNIISGLENLFIDFTEFSRKTEKCIYAENFLHSIGGVELKDLISFNFKRISPWHGDTAVLLEDMEYMLSQKGSCVILAGEEKAARVLYENLLSRGKKATLAITVPDKVTAGITVMCGGLSAGFELPDNRFMLITQNYIHSDSRKKIRHKNENAIGSLDELHIGDYVVHLSHGIGIFAGINKITGRGVTKDYIKINYAKGDTLYVPVTQLDLISKYIGTAEDGTVKLNRLGSGDWQKTRARVKKSVKDMAKQLTALYAKRMAIKGYAFARDTELQADFERTFPYVETDAQRRCVDEIKADMERETPMDRLLCGDVGFGKTEVALRAAFKCISEGKQCAFLVPTTILAWQHYNTILRRFGEMPVNVKMLSRFVSPSAQSKVVAGLKSGKVDMVVGTHRLISKDVQFKNIGLVIVDEEQRFGVAQKERLKELYPFVDVLTLSATPIPRTLNMAVSGLRDMSSIDEAPGARQPVQSYVMEYNQGMITDAIRKELRRSGQVYYLHNRVESIVRCAAKLKELLPDARIEVAHGKMSEEELSAVWQRLIEHEIDVLVCTTIIETGVDVPNANTLIIEDADRMGLSQLHQLRGRVGRSPRRAYAYFCFKGGKQISEVAEKRLEAIREYTEFGAGFKIAMRDLEIRGAGSLLGGEQHGNMEAVGYDMFIRLLREAIGEEKGEQVLPEAECTVDLNISAHIPESYIRSLPARLGIYKRIAAVRCDADKSDVIDELCDRFGEPPKTVLGLIDIALLRNKAASLGIYEITEGKNSLILKVNAVSQPQVEKLNDAFGSRLVLSANEKPFYTVKSAAGQRATELIAEIASEL